MFNTYDADTTVDVSGMAASDSILHYCSSVASHGPQSTRRNAHMRCVERGKAGFPKKWDQSMLTAPEKLSSLADAMSC